MTKKKLLLYVQAALCALWVILMAVSAIRIYLDGAAIKAQGHPEVWIYTQEKAAAAFAAYMPLLLAAIAVTVACYVLRVRDEKQDMPVRDPDLIALYKRERETSPGTGHARADAPFLRKIRAALLALAVVFIIAGIANGSMEDVLIKAVNICTECIGLG